jgi:hypothetical protein
LAQQVQNLHVVFNNNRSGYAPNNAAQFREMMGQQVQAQPQKLIHHMGRIERPSRPGDIWILKGGSSFGEVSRSLDFTPHRHYLRALPK